MATRRNLKFPSPRFRHLLRVVLVLSAVMVLLGITMAYQNPALRKTIVFSGFGLC